MQEVNPLYRNISLWAFENNLPDVVIRNICSRNKITYGEANSFQSAKVPVQGVAEIYLYDCRFKSSFGGIPIF